MYLLGFFILYLLLICSPSIGNDTKRLLVSDPNAIQTMLHEYEIRLQGYQTMVQQLQQEVANLKANQNVVQQDVTTMKINQHIVQQLQHDVTTLKGNQNLVQQLQQDYTSLKANQNLVQRDITTLKANQTTMHQLQLELETYRNVGTTYVRWGRKTCPPDNNTEKVYDGIAGGSLYKNYGAAVDFLCLPHNPDNTLIAKNVSSYGHYVGLLYGGEYQFNYGNVRIDDDVPCVVCRVRQMSSLLMIPAKSGCPFGWRNQYSGLLSSNDHKLEAASQYVCVDGHPEYFDGTRSHDDNGKLFYPVRTVCGSLPCPPYVNNSFVECVICTK